MERLVFSSSSPLPSRTTAHLNPRLFLLPRANPTGRFKVPFLPHAGPRPAAGKLSVQQEGPPPGYSSASCCARRFAVRCAGKAEGPAGSDAPGGLLDGRRSEDFVRKVASTGLFALLSTVVLALIQPILARPALAAFGSAATQSGGTLVKTELFTSAWTGFFAGCLHTLSGPDHLAALAPLSIGRTRMESAIVGALWGCGHDAGQVIFGCLFLLLKDRLHIEVIRTWGTRVVGFTLLVIGAMGIKEATETPTPCVALENGECDVTVTESVEVAPNGKRKIGLATFATGIVHGLQPDALMMVLPALALPSRVAGAAFLGMFLVGTVVAMGSYTVFIGSCSQALKDRVPRITEKLTWASSLIAICMGLGIIISQFFGFSLY